MIAPLCAVVADIIIADAIGMTRIIVVAAE
jgi:hypothetical protein